MSGVQVTQANLIIVTYQAFVRRDGTYETRAAGFRRWNDELLWRMNQDMTSPWANFLTLLESEVSLLRKKVKGKLDDLRRRLNGR